MRKLLLVLAIMILASCSPQRRLANLLERFPPEITTHIEYRDTIIYRDAFFEVYLPGATVYDSIIVEKLVEIEVDVPYTFLYAETMLAEATASIQNNKLRLELIQRDSLFRFLLDSAIREHSDTTIITNNIPFPVIEKAKSFWKHGFIVLAGLFVVGVLLFFLFRRR